MTVYVAHATAGLIMVGVIWTVQVAHYPSFRYVDAEQFASFESFHQRAITYIVGPAMLLELTTALWLLVSRPPSIPFWLVIVGAALLAAIWFSTFFIQVPFHTRLAQTFDREAIEGLVRSNWIRTVAWTARGLLLIGGLALALRRDRVPA